MKDLTHYLIWATLGSRQYYTPHFTEDFEKSHKLWGDINVRYHHHFKKYGVRYELITGLFLEIVSGSLFFILVPNFIFLLCL